MSIRGARTRALILAAVVVVAGVVIPATSAQAATATSTSTLAVQTNVTTSITGMSVAGFGGSTVILTSVSASTGTLTLTSTTGLTASAGFSFSGQSVSFTGTQDAVNDALPSLTYNAGATPGTTSSATITINAVANTSNLSFNPANNHFYKYFSGNTLWSSADTAAAATTYGGLSGYLVTITSSSENDFVTSKAGGSNLWIGAYDTSNGGTPRTWKWNSTNSPEFGTTFTTCTSSTGACDYATSSYRNWASGEPNNGGGEYAAVTNLGSANGLWNDLSPSSGSATGYVVEYGTNASDGGTSSVRATDTTTLVVADQPGPITNATIGAVAGGASLNFTAPTTGATVTGYQYSINGGSTWSTLQIVGTAGNQRTGLIQGLTAGTSYSVVLRATSAVLPSPETSVLPVTPTAAPGGGTAPPTTSPSASPTPSASPSVSPSPSVTPTAPPQAAPVPVIAPVPTATSAALVFTQPTTSGVVSSYQYRLNNGSWQTLTVSTDSSGQVTATVPGLAQATTYAIEIRAVNSLGAGPVTSMSVTTGLDTSWFRDPVGAGARSTLIAVPSNPKSYHGKLAFTKARYTSYAGRAVVPVSTLKKRPIVTGQGALVSGSKLFVTRKGKLVLTAKGKAQAKVLATSLRLDAGIRCEGYSDYTGSKAKQASVARARAKAMCAALDAYTTGTTAKPVSYAAKRPVVVGGKAARRGANYRIVVMVTKTKS